MVRASSYNCLAYALLAILVATGLAGCRRDRSQEPSTSSPNVLIYLIDTLRADSLEPYGNAIVDTPAIQRFADEGVLFERAHAHSAWTRPSIASILTGLAPDAHGIATRHDHAAARLRMLAEVLKEHGYTTGAIITNPNVGSYFGFDQGYDEFIELYQETGGADVEQKGDRAPSDEVTRRAIEWMRDAQRPFFLFIVTIDPHWPYTPPSRFDRYRGVNAPAKPATRSQRKMERKRGRYFGEIAFNDDSFGRLIDHMRESGAYDESLIVFTSDHGEAFGEHGSESHGKTLFAEAVRVPLVIRRPNEKQAGRRVEHPVQLIDVFPTVLDVIGLPPPPSGEGRPLLGDTEPTPREIYALLDLDGYSGEMIVRPPWKLISPNTKMTGGLFDLDRDPRELRDLRGDEPELVIDLLGRLEERFAESRRSGEAEPASEREPADLPSDVRDALQALGYLEPADTGAAASLPGEAPSEP